MNLRYCMIGLLAVGGSVAYALVEARDISCDYCARRWAVFTGTRCHRCWREWRATRESRGAR